MAIPRPQFSALQTKTFPIYFGLQTALPAILALTYPGGRSPIGAPSSLRGTFAEANRWNVLAPILTIFATGLVNLMFVGPATTRIMKERKQQGKLNLQCNLRRANQMTRNKGRKEEL
jgi:hypothetical protein